jgi:hypothetical protein
MVVGEKGAEKVDPVRTSYSAGLAIGQDATVRRVEQRIAEWTHLPVSHGEPIEVRPGRARQRQAEAGSRGGGGPRLPAGAVLRGAWRALGWRAGRRRRGQRTGPQAPRRAPPPRAAASRRRRLLPPHAAASRRRLAPPQVLRYQNGQKYDSHWDWFDERDEQDRSKGNRIATVLMYLSGEHRQRGRGGRNARAGRCAARPSWQAGSPARLRSPAWGLVARLRSAAWGLVARLRSAAWGLVAWPRAESSL